MLFSHITTGGFVKRLLWHEVILLAVLKVDSFSNV